MPELRQPHVAPSPTPLAPSAEAADVAMGASNAEDLMRGLHAAGTSLPDALGLLASTFSWEAARPYWRECLTGLREAFAEVAMDEKRTPHTWIYRTLDDIHARVIRSCAVIGRHAPDAAQTALFDWFGDIEGLNPEGEPPSLLFGGFPVPGHASGWLTTLPDGLRLKDLTLRGCERFETLPSILKTDTLTIDDCPEWDGVIGPDVIAERVATPGHPWGIRLAEWRSRHPTNQERDTLPADTESDRTAQDTLAAMLAVGAGRGEALLQIAEALGTEGVRAASTTWWPDVVGILQRIEGANAIEATNGNVRACAGYDGDSDSPANVCPTDPVTINDIAAILAYDHDGGDVDERTRLLFLTRDDRFGYLEAQEDQTNGLSCDEILVARSLRDLVRMGLTKEARDAWGFSSDPS